MLKFIIDEIIDQQDLNKVELAEKMGISEKRYLTLEKTNFEDMTTKELFELCYHLKISPLIFSHYDFSNVNHRFARNDEKDILITKIIPDLKTYSPSALEAVTLLNETSLIALNDLVNKMGSTFLQASEEFDEDEDEFNLVGDEFLV